MIGNNKQPGFIFGGDTGVSYGDLQRKRQVVDALMACAVKRRVFPAGASPAQQLSLRLVATWADHGGNNMV